MSVIGPFPTFRPDILNVPSSISGLIRWYDAQSLVGLNNGDPVSAWTDKTGNANLTQSGSARPTYVSSDATFGNVPCVQFDGVSQFMSCANPAIIAMTVFVVARSTDHATTRVLLGFVGGNHVIFVDGSSSKWEWFGPFEAAASGASASPSPAIIRFTSTSIADFRAETGAWVNFDPTDGYDGAGSMLLGANPPVGVSNFFQGFVGEIAIYNSALADSDVNLLGNYFSTRWNFTWTNL